MRQRRTQKRNTRSKDFDPISGIADAAEHVVEEVTTEAERVVTPVSKRYPTLFMLLVTFGVVTTLYGFERVVQEVPYIGERPLIILIIGIAVLIFTGTLYKKLR